MHLRTQETLMRCIRLVRFPAPASLNRAKLRAVYAAQPFPASTAQTVTSLASPALEHFVRGTLGCKCPDEVFQAIAIDRTESHTRLVVGNRLLIYVLETSPGKAPGKALARLAEQGLTDRNAQRLNRFRLVIASTQPTLALADAKANFAEAVGDDDRAHLHVIAVDQLPAELRHGTAN
jgi:hypothetical protein